MRKYHYQPIENHRALPAAARSADSVDRSGHAIVASFRFSLLSMGNCTCDTVYAIFKKRKERKTGLDALFPSPRHPVFQNDLAENSSLRVIGKREELLQNSLLFLRQDRMVRMIPCGKSYPTSVSSAGFQGVGVQEGLAHGWGVYF